MFVSLHDLEVKQELLRLEERMDYETQKLHKKVTRLLQFNNQLYQLNSTKAELREELQQLEQLLFVKALNQKSTQLEQERKLALTQKAASEEQSKEVEQLKRTLQEKTNHAELLQQQLVQFELFQKRVRMI